MTIEKTVRRRSVLTGVTTGLVSALAGCMGQGDSGGQDNSSPADDTSSPIESITVDETQLVIDLERNTVTQVNVIDPAGELFANRPIEAGVSQTTVDLGFEYPPGTYEFIALSGDETLGAATMDLEPDLEFSDLRLARDYPEEMYEGADQFAMEGDGIVYVTNHGSGPTAITALRFRGDVPHPTHSSYDETGDSGIVDLENDFSRYADAVIIPSGKTVRVYSNNRPFTPSRIYNKCETIGKRGEFTVEFTSTHASEDTSAEYSIQYLTSETGDCVFDIEGSA